MRTRTLILIAGMTIGLTATVSGCGKKDDAAQKGDHSETHADMSHESHGHEGHDHAMHDDHSHGDHAAHTEADTDAEFNGNKTCPVMGGAVNKDLYVDHDGKRIYVCCEGCIDAIKKNPEKYLKKLEEMGEEPGTI